MKKIIFSLIILSSILLFATNVYASSFNVNIVGDDTFESEITLYIQVDNLDNFIGVCNGLCGLVSDLSYDTNKIELISLKALENFDLTSGSTLVLYKSTGVGSGTKILSMVFKNKSLTKNETTTITLSNIQASDGDNDINTSNVSKTIKHIVKETTNSKNNDTTNNSTNEPTDKTNNKSNNTIKKSSNNYLSSISLSEGTITFDKDTFIYDVLVSYKTSSIVIMAEAEDALSTLTGNGTYNLKIGNNVIELRVKAEDESERTYILNVYREKEPIDDNGYTDKVMKKDTKKEKNKIVLIIGGIFFVITLGIVCITIYRSKKNN